MNRIRWSVGLALLFISSAMACDDPTSEAPQKRTASPSDVSALLSALANSESGELVIGLKAPHEPRGIRLSGVILPEQARRQAENAIKARFRSLKIVRGVERHFFERVGFQASIRQATSHSMVVAAPPDSQLLERLVRHPNVDFVSPRRLLFFERSSAEATTRAISSSAGATFEFTPWGIDSVRAPAVWDSVRGRISIAIIDTGADFYPFEHPDLECVIPPGETSCGSVFINMAFDPLDPLAYPEACQFLNQECFYEEVYHGTGVAGTFVASENGAFSIGVAPGAWWRYYYKIAYDSVANGVPIFVVRPSDWELAIDDIIEKNDAALNPTIRIVVTGIGANTNDPNELPELRAAFARLVFRLRAVYFVAASNSSNIGVPAVWSEAVAVAAIGRNYFPAFQTNGPELDFVAPGWQLNDITWNRNDEFLGTATKSGNSYAVGIVAGIAALAWETDTSQTPGEIRSRLRQTAIDLGPPGRDNDTGFGMPDAWCAVEFFRGCDHVFGPQPPFNPGAAPLSVAINGPAFVPQNHECTWIANTSGGELPLEFEWFRDGQLVSQTDIYTDDTGSNDFGLQLEVTSWEGQTSSDDASVVISLGMGDCFEVN